MEVISVVRTGYSVEFAWRILQIFIHSVVITVFVQSVYQNGFVSERTTGAQCVEKRLIFTIMILVYIIVKAKV